MKRAASVCRWGRRKDDNYTTVGQNKEEREGEKEKISGLRKTKSNEGEDEKGGRLNKLQRDKEVPQDERL